VSTLYCSPKTAANRCCWRNHLTSLRLAQHPAPKPGHEPNQTSMLLASPSRHWLSTPANYIRHRTSPLRPQEQVIARARAGDEAARRCLIEDRSPYVIASAAFVRHFLSSSCNPFSPTKRR
jgi:hypothetical protein